MDLRLLPAFALRIAHVEYRRACPPVNRRGYDTGVSLTMRPCCEWEPAEWRSPPGAPHPHCSGAPPVRVD